MFTAGPNAVFVNMLIERAGSETWGTEHGWRWMFAAGAIPAIIFALTMLFSRESPRWLMKVGRERQAKEVLAEMEGSDLAGREASAIINSLTEERETRERAGGSVAIGLDGSFVRVLLDPVFGHYGELRRVRDLEAPSAAVQRPTQHAA